MSQTSSLIHHRRRQVGYPGRRPLVSRRGLGRPPPMMGLTENGSATYKSTSNPCLDLFFHVVPDTPARKIVKYLNKSWPYDPLTTLKLIFNLRGVRGTGKNDKESFYTAALWLHKYHPKTLAENLAAIASFGYLKDLPEILFRILEGPQARWVMKDEWLSKKNMARQYHDDLCNKKRLAKMKKRVRQFDGDGDGDSDDGDGDGDGDDDDDDDGEKKKISAVRLLVAREERIQANMVKIEDEKKRARALRKEKQLLKSEKALERYSTDVNYKLLHDKISTLFADLLKADIQSLNSGQAKNISLAGKWCPTIDSSYDKYTLICESIAKKVFPRDCYPEYEGIEEAHYAFRVRDRLRKQVLVPLHEVLKLPEVYMSAKKWDSIPYSRVASLAMQTYTDNFLHRDNQRFREYLEDVKEGKSKIAAGALLPHSIIESFKRGSGAGIVAELQWKRMVDDLLKKGKFTNCIAVCDVSGSMEGTPMEVAVAIGLLVAELSEEPWKGHVITFSERPMLHLIQGSSLRDKTEFVRKMDWGLNTDFQKVFDRILEVAVNGKLSEEHMVKRVFVFSDMEFDQASSYPWETDYQAIQRKFWAGGYRVPEIIFWNLRDSSATPVTDTQNGVALLSGFSKNLLTLFLEGGGKINPKDLKAKSRKLNPEAVMEAAISGEEYQKLVVADVDNVGKGRKKIVFYEQYDDNVQARGNKIITYEEELMEEFDDLITFDGCRSSRKLTNKWMNDYGLGRNGKQSKKKIR